ncbi:hypothetical protein LTR95_018281, partial [Oleoguttula sp. CCFEE 5521]
VELSQQSTPGNRGSIKRESPAIAKEGKSWNSGKLWIDEHIRALLEDRAADGVNPYHTMERTLGRTAQALRLKVLHHIKLADDVAYDVAIRAARVAGESDPEKPPRRSGKDYADDNLHGGHSSTSMQKLSILGEITSRGSASQYLRLSTPSRSDRMSRLLQKVARELSVLQLP